MYFLLLVMSDGCLFYAGHGKPFSDSIGSAYLFADAKSAASRVTSVLQSFPDVKLCIPLSIDSVSSVLLHDLYDYFGGIIK